MVSNVTTGAVQSSDYVIRLKADNGNAVFNAAVPAGTDPLPLLLDGMNPNWSCGLWQNGRMAIFSSLEQKMYALIKPGFSGKVAAGHPLTSSDPELVIEWEGIWQGGVRARLHNPLPREMEFEIRTSPFMPDMPDYQSKFKLSPGESIWLWGSKQVTVIEKPDFIVNKVEKTDSGINIKVSNGKNFLCEQGKNVIINRGKP
jgi:hypothetical protein